MLYLSTTPYFQAANDMSSPVTRFSGLAPPKRGRPHCLAGNEGRRHAVSRLTAADAWHVVRTDNGSSPVPPNGQLCGLFAADIAGFNGSRRDDDIQLYVHKSLYEMLQAAFERADVPWSGCAHEDRGDGVLVVIPPTIPVSGLVDPIPDRLRGLIRRHNRVSCEAAQIQLRIATHIGPVHSDGHGFVGRDVNLLYRLLDARALKRMLSESGAEVAFIASSYVYDTVIRRRPSLVDPAVFQPLAVRVKETRARAWACVLGA
jgi:class 3 adenylate cyclase